MLWSNGLFKYFLIERILWKLANKSETFDIIWYEMRIVKDNALKQEIIYVQTVGVKTKPNSMPEKWAQIVEIARKMSADHGSKPKKVKHLISYDIKMRMDKDNALKQEIINVHTVGVKTKPPGQKNERRLWK